MTRDDVIDLAQQLYPRAKCTLFNAGKARYTSSGRDSSFGWRLTIEVPGREVEHIDGQDYEELCAELWKRRSAVADFAR